MNKTNRTWLTLIPLLSLFALMLAACGGPASQSENGQGTGGQKPVTISFIHWRGEDTKAFNAIIDRFEQENPKIKVQMEAVNSDQYTTIAQAKLSDGSVGDVFASFPGAQFEALSKVGLFADLTNEPFLQNFTPSLIEAGIKDGKQLAVPYQLVYNMPIYNVKLFEKFNLQPPKDWDGFLALCETLKSNGIIPIAFPGADVAPGQFMNTMVMNNAPDPDIFPKLEAGQTKLTDEWWVKTLAQVKELSDRGYFQKDALGTKNEAAGALFIQEKAAMLATGSFQMAQNKQKNPNLEQKLLAPITVSADKAVFEGIHTTTFMLAVNSKSKHPAEAKKFLEFLSRKDIAAQYANETGQNVTVNDVEYTSQELNNIAEWTTRQTRFQPRYTIKNAEVQKAVMSTIQDMLAGKTPEASAKAAQAIVEQQIKP